MILELNENEMREIYGGESEESGQIVKYYVNEDDGIHVGWENN